MSDRFVVEADRQVVGVAVRVAGGYQFFTSNAEFQFLEGTVFPRARSMRHRVAEAAQQLKQRKRPKQ